MKRVKKLTDELTKGDLVEVNGELYRYIDKGNFFKKVNNGLDYVRDKSKIQPSSQARTTVF